MNTMPPVIGIQRPVARAEAPRVRFSARSMPCPRAKASAVAARPPACCQKGSAAVRVGWSAAAGAKAATAGGKVASCAGAAPRDGAAPARRSARASGPPARAASAAVSLDPSPAASGKLKSPRLDCAAALFSQGGISPAAGATPAWRARSTAAPLPSPTPAANSSASVAMPPASCQGRGVLVSPLGSASDVNGAVGASGPKAGCRASSEATASRGSRAGGTTVSEGVPVAARAVGTAAPAAPRVASSSSLSGDSR